MTEDSHRPLHDPLAEPLDPDDRHDPDHQDQLIPAAPTPGPPTEPGRSLESPPAEINSAAYPSTFSIEPPPYSADDQSAPAEYRETPLPSFLANYPYHSAEPPSRIPNFGHLLIFAILIIGGYLCSGMAIFAAMRFHLYGVATLKEATNDIHYTLGSQAIWYFATFVGCLLTFPVVWHRGFLDGLGWHAGSAFRLRLRLIGAAVVCFVLALIDGIFIPGPQDTPIDQMFRMPGAAWLLFAFGITLAPFFEETAFRGFLLPALCTAYDWAQERISHAPAPPLDETAHPRWSLPAMTVGSILTSIPFALMHGEQTGYSPGPFLLLVCVSLVLCWVRLATRSLASSVLVHACYNLLLFSLMLAGTGGFKHLDKL